VPASAAAQSGVVAITYRDFAIDPDATKVKVGSTLKWTNFDPVANNVTSIGPGAMKIASGSFGEGKSFEVKVTKAGVIHYESTNYPTTMNGTIVVVQ
jgi:plastocyanin